MTTKNSLRSHYRMPNSDDLITVSTRVTREHADWIRQAAHMRDESNSEYLRNLIVPAVAAELGLPAPDLTEYCSRDYIAEAASAAGLSVREWTMRVAQEAAREAVRARMVHGERADRESFLRESALAESGGTRNSESGMRSNESGAHRLDLRPDSRPDARATLIPPSTAQRRKTGSER